MLTPLKGHFCTSGMRFSCESGHYCELRRLNHQRECEAGYFCSTVTEIQLACPSGKYSQAKATECTPCQPGTEASFEISSLH